MLSEKRKNKDSKKNKDLNNGEFTPLNNPNEVKRKKNFFKSLKNDFF